MLHSLYTSIRIQIDFLKRVFSSESNSELQLRSAAALRRIANWGVTWCLCNVLCQYNMQISKWHVQGNHDCTNHFQCALAQERLRILYIITNIALSHGYLNGYYNAIDVGKPFVILYTGTIKQPAYHCVDTSAFHI